MKNLFLSLLILLAISCQDVLEVPDTGRKIVINSLLSSDSVFAVNISQSMYIADTTRWLGSEENPDAAVYIYLNDQVIDTLKYKKLWSNSNFFILESNYRSEKEPPASGQTYKIVAKIPGFPDATASTTSPTKVEINKLDTTLLTLQGNFNEWESNKRLICDINFTDPASENNYYLVYVFCKKYFDHSSLMYDPIMTISCDDPIVEEELKHGTIQFGVAFTDKSFNGKQQQVRITLNGRDIGCPFICYDNPYPMPQWEKTTLFFRLYSITEDYFKYIQTLNLFLENYKNPLAEPTQVYSNIEGGYGIFAGAAVSCDSIVLTGN